MNRTLFLNENSLPAKFTRGTISGKELRLRAAIDEIDEVHVLCRPGKGFVVKPGKENEKQTSLEKKIIVHYLPSWPYYLSSTGLFIWGAYWVRKLKPIVIEAESPLWSGPAVVLLGKIFNIPSVVEIRASYNEILKIRFKWMPEFVKKFLHDLIYWNVLKLSDKVITNSKFYKKQIAKRKIKSVEINPGIQYPPSLTEKFLSKPVIGFIGRLVSEKGIDLLIEAFVLARRELKEKWQLEIVGDGPELESLEKMTFHKGIRHLVNFRGIQDNYASIARWSLMVNPNTVFHPLEMVNAEAAYMGVGVICYGNNQVPETVIDKITGVKVNEISALSLSRAIIEVANNRRLMNRLGKNGGEFALKNYSMSDQVKKLKKMYAKMGILKRTSD